MVCYYLIHDACSEWLLSITFYLSITFKNYLLILMLIEWLCMINFSGSYIIKFIFVAFVLIEGRTLKYLHLLYVPPICSVSHCENRCFFLGQALKYTLDNIFYCFKNLRTETKTINDTDHMINSSSTLSFINYPHSYRNNVSQNCLRHTFVS